MAERPKTRLDAILSRWQVPAAVLAGIVVINIVAHVLVIQKTGAVSGDRERILDAARQRVATVRAEVDELERTASKLACTESDVAQVYDEMLSSKTERMTSIQREVRELAKKRGLDADRIAYKATEVRDTGLVRFSISFPLEGEYGVLEDFVQAVEQSENFLIVDEIAIDEAQGQALRLRVELATYFQAPDAEELARALAARRRS